MTGKEYFETRKKLGLTQQKLAAAVGVAVSTIQAREQQPDKEVGAEASSVISALAGRIVLGHSAE